MTSAPPYATGAAHWARAAAAARGADAACQGRCPCARLARSSGRPRRPWPGPWWKRREEEEEEEEREEDKSPAARGREDRRGKRIRKKGEDGRHYDERDKVDRTMGGVLEKKNIAVQFR